MGGAHLLLRRGLFLRHFALIRSSVETPGSGYEGTSDPNVSTLLRIGIILDQGFLNYGFLHF